MSSKTWYSSLETSGDCLQQLDATASAELLRCLGPGLIDQVRDSVYHLYLAATGQSGRMSRQEGIDNARTLAKFVV